MEFLSLSLLAGSPYVIPEMQIELIQPKIKDIALLGEFSFYQAVSVFGITKEAYQKQVEKTIEEQELDEETRAKLLGQLALTSNLTIVLEVLNGNNDLKNAFTGLLFLLLPKLQKCSIDERIMLLSFLDGDKRTDKIISDTEFSLLSHAIGRMFDMGEKDKSAFNPSNDKAAQIAAKIESRRSKVAKETGKDGQKTSALATAVSIISTADGIPLQEVLNYTIPQLHFQLERSKKYSEFQTQITLGAFGGLQDVEIAEWMHSI